MRSLAGKDWKLLDDIVIKLTGAGSIPELDQRLLGSMFMIVPGAVHAGIFEVGSDFKIVVKKLAGQLIEQKWLDLWFQRFSHRLPASYDLSQNMQVITWQDVPQDDFASEFMIPQGFGATLYLTVSPGFGGYRRVLSLSLPVGSIFGNNELRLAELLLGHLPGLYSVSELLDRDEQERLWQITTAIKGTGLSRREAEVVHHLCRHLTIPEVSKLMSLSTRTIETYVSRAYSKLGVYDRKGLYRRLLPFLNSHRVGIQTERGAKGNSCFNTPMRPLVKTRG